MLSRYKRSEKFVNRYQKVLLIRIYYSHYELFIILLRKITLCFCIIYNHVLRFYLQIFYYFGFFRHSLQVGTFADSKYKLTPHHSRDIILSVR